MAPGNQRRSKRAANLVHPTDQAGKPINQDGPGDDIPFHIYILNPLSSFSTTTDPFEAVSISGDSSKLTKELSGIVKSLFQSLLDNMHERQEKRIPAIRAPDDINGHVIIPWRPDRTKIAPEMRNEFGEVAYVVHTYTISYLGGRYDDSVLPLGYYVLRDYPRDLLLAAGIRHEDVATLVNELCREEWPNGREGIYEES